MRPLDGVRVVDFTEGAQGPFAASLLADLGAEVVKVERPAGELMRHVGPFRAGLALPMLSIARGRHATLALDVKQQADREVVLRLVGAADVLVQNWKPGTDARLGLDFEQVRRIAPGIVYVSASGYGVHGPFGTMGAMDSLSQAISGLSSLSGDPAGRGERTRTPILDFVSAFVTAEAAMVGLAARRRSGRATRVDTSQMSAALDAAAPQVAASAGGPVAPAGRAGRRRAFGGWFECADGRFVSIECRDADEVGRVAEALGVAAGDGAVGPAIVRALAAMPADAALDRLRGVGLDAHAVVRRFHPDVFEAWPGAVGAVHDERVGEIRHPQTPFVFDVTGARAGAPLGPIGRDNPLIGALIAAWQARSPAPATPERPDAP